MIRHVAMFRFREQVSLAEREAARDALASNGDHCPTVRSYTVGLDLGRKPANWDMVLVADFDDREGLESYSNHPHHNAMAQVVEKVTRSDETARVQFDYDRA